MAVTAVFKRKPPHLAEIGNHAFSAALTARSTRKISAQFSNASLLFTVNRCGKRLESRLRRHEHSRRSISNYDRTYSEYRNCYGTTEKTDETCPLEEYLASI